MTEKRISHCQGKGSLTHNNRKFSAKNVDEARTKDNVVFVEQPIDVAYEQLFGAAVERYNAKQKRADRKIKTSYYEHLFKRSPAPSVVTSADKRKSFYEDVVQIGTMQDTGVGTPDAEIAAACLTEYMQGFQERNPNFHVFNAVLHLDEATPHLHIDYIPIGHYKQGVDTQNGIAQALKEMGYGTGKDAIARWREAECKLLTEICNRHGIQIAAPEQSRGSLTVEQYKEYAKVKEQTDEKKKEVARLDEQAEELEKRYEQAQKDADKIDSITEIVQTAEVITHFKKPTGYIKMPADEFVKLKKAAKGFDEDRREIKQLQEVTTAEISKLKKENDQAAEKNSALEQEVRSLYPLKESLRKAEQERDSLKAKLQKVMEFIASLNLKQKLQEFLKPRVRGLRK